MLDISFDIELNDKEDLNTLTSILKQLGLEKPIYIVELENAYLINFESEYQYDGEIENEMIKVYSDYEFTGEIGTGQRNIKMIIRSTQSPLSSDNWGRQLNSDTIEKVKYFIKKSEAHENTSPNPVFKVLLDDFEKEYTVNIVPGINSATNEKGFLVVKEITSEIEKPDLLINELFADRSTAFWKGYYKLIPQVSFLFEIFKSFNSPFFIIYFFTVNPYHYWPILYFIPNHNSATVN
ncbi:MAG TPA: hypothetical protein VIM07_16210 [Chitinophagaceae bacterium]